MKTLFFFIAALICFNTTGFSELNVADLEKIRQMNTETEARLEKRIAAEIKAQSAEIKVLSTEIKALGELFRTEIRAQSERFSAEINGLSKRLDFQGQLMIALIIAFVTAHLGVILYQHNKRRSQQSRR